MWCFVWLGCLVFGFVFLLKFMLLSFFHKLQIDTFDGLDFQLLQTVSVCSNGLMVNYTGARFGAL